MKKMKKMLTTVTLAIASLVVALHSVSAQTYPTKPVRVLVPFVPGSSADGLARLVLQEFQDTIGGTYVIENKAGANGLIAAEEAARSKPDGYTLFFTTNTTQAVNPGFFKDIKYDPIKDFTPIAQLITGQFILVANNNVAAKSVSELVALAKADPKKLAYATTNGTSLVAAELLKARAGVEIRRVPYKSSPQAFLDLMSGEIAVMFGDALNATPLIESGKIRALAVSGAQRAALLPDVPTMEQAGFPGFVLQSWAGLFGPAGMDAALVEKMNGVITNAVKNKPAFADRIRALGYVPVSPNVKEFTDFTKAEVARWGGAMKEAKIVPE